MIDHRQKSQRIVIVGGGFAGLSIAARLARSGFPVTLLESSQLGFDASTRNQGWLFSGAWFAPQQTELARMCYESLQLTLEFCPDCIEPNHEGMAFLITNPKTTVGDWTDSWNQAGIPYKELPRSRLQKLAPPIAISEIERAFLLPDRSFCPKVLLKHLANVATAAGAEIRTASPVDRLLRDGDQVIGVSTATGEEVYARLVILATGASGSQFWSEIMPNAPGDQPGYCLVALKAHLIALHPRVCSLPFCVVDLGGFNHLPHARTSVFGLNRWLVVADASDQHVVVEEIEILRQQISRIFPQLRAADVEVREWAGTTVQAMHADQIEPGRLPLPTVIDHARESPPLSHLLSVFPGRATLWASLAEQALEVVLDTLDEKPTNTSKSPWSVE